MTSEETAIVDDNRCLATGCRCLYTINGHLCQRCYWQRRDRLHAGWCAELGTVLDPDSIELEIHPRWHDLAIVAKCEAMIATAEKYEEEQRARRAAIDAAYEGIFEDTDASNERK